MTREMKKVAILGGKRVPFARSFTQYKRTTNQDLLIPVLNALASSFKLEGENLGDVAMGAVIQQPRDWNLAREAVLGSTLGKLTPGYNVQRACGTSLETVNHIALKIASGQIEVGIAGGADNNSDAPFSYPREFGWKMIDVKSAGSMGARLAALAKLRPADLAPDILGVREARTGLSMGEHCELMVKEWKISRSEQDALALESHQKAAKAYAEGFYKDLLVEHRGLSKDTFVRGDTSIEKLGKLKPAFDFTGSGTLTAGNSSPLTDGASAVLMSSEEYARKKNLPVLAYFVDCEAAAVDFVGGEGLLMAPTVAVAKLLQRNKLSLQDFDFYEIHEAFAGQVACTLKAWESDDYYERRLGLSKKLGSIDRTKMNVKGGSLAVGHPFGATGSRIVASLAKILSANKKGRGLISICTAGGMGVAAIIEV